MKTFTPEIAKRRFCPHTQQGRCEGEDCMMWRWSEEPRTEAYQEDVVRIMKETGASLPKAQQKAIKDREKYKHTEGYCGLAGEPKR